MAGAQSGDQAAYARLLREATPLLRVVARRRLPNPADAEDVVQDTLLAVHRLRHAYDPSRPLKPWLVAICERRCADHHRRQARHPTLPLAGEMAGRIPAPDAAEAAPARVAAVELHKAIAALPTAQRIALQLCKLQARPLAEASALSGRPETALKVATHRAIRSLRLRFGPQPA